MKLTKKQESENESRAQRGRNVMDSYGLELGCHDRENLCDLLADLMHMAAIDCESEPFDDALRSARMHFEAETSKETA